MTQHINTKALHDAIQEHSDERLQKDLREWLVYTAPIEVQDIWKRYIEKVEEEEIKAAKQVAISAWFFVGVVVLFVAWATFDVISASHLIRSCIK
jgi:5'-deoxynucleotidase YfbR-like HD superfamily hydrolase